MNVAAYQNINILNLDINYIHILKMWLHNYTVKFKTCVHNPQQYQFMLCVCTGGSKWGVVLVFSNILELYIICFYKSHDLQ